MESKEHNQNQSNHEYVDYEYRTGSSKNQPQLFIPEYQEENPNKP